MEGDASACTDDVAAIARSLGVIASSDSSGEGEDQGENEEEAGNEAAAKEPQVPMDLLQIASEMASANILPNGTVASLTLDLEARQPGEEGQEDADAPAAQPALESDDDEEEDVLQGLERPMDDDADEEGGQAFVKSAPRTKNEIEAPVVALDAEATAGMANRKIDRIGEVLALMEGMTVVVRGDEGGRPLDEGSVLCCKAAGDEGELKPLGHIHETFGPVKQPHYTVREKEGASNGLLAGVKVGEPVYCVVELSTFLRPENMLSKGCDASNVHDEEPNANEIEFSDDEAESAARAAKGAAKKKRGREARGVGGRGEAGQRPG
ncbi:unnamed protein product, partial [Chrysoparadoxa australica]